MSEAAVQTTPPQPEPEAQPAESTAALAARLGASPSGLDRQLAPQLRKARL
eukprot:COSAG01_NODE_12608_length_1711_cov_68.346154_1_plen_50_part_10